MGDTVWRKERWNWLLILFVIVFGGILVGSGLAAWRAVTLGAIKTAAQISTFASAMATVALVLITGFYAHFTRKMVGVMRETREQEVELRDQQREEKKRKMRRALINEIKITTMWADTKIEGEEFRTGQASYPTMIFESLTDDIGVLTDEEIMSLLNFYNNALALEEVILLRRENPSIEVVAVMERMVILSEAGKQVIDTLKEHLGEETEVSSSSAID